LNINNYHLLFLY